MSDLTVYSGADPRLESEILTHRDNVLHFLAPADGARVALYGPYIDLPPGLFRIELDFTVKERAPGQVTLELCRSGASVKIYTRTCFDWELEAGRIRLCIPFDDGVEGLEIRLIVPANFSGAIRQLSFARLT